MIRKFFSKESSLSDFASFLHEETILVNDPVLSKDAVLDYVQIPEWNHDKKKKYRSFVKIGGEVVKCSLCEGNHDLDDCKSFLQFDLQERSKCLFQNKLCYGCLGAISVNNKARNSKNTKECKVFKKRHPTSLYGFKAEKNKGKQPIVTLQKNPN